MADLPKELLDRYKKDATKHADFLCQKVFTPAFEMGFIHRAKHMYDELIAASKTGDITDEITKKLAK